MSLANHVGRWLVTIGALASLVGLQVVTATPSHAGTTCALNPNTHVAEADEFGEMDVTITRSASGNVLFGSANCGSVTAVDRVNIELGGGLIIINFDMSHGALGPGFTPEASGASEIEFTFSDLSTAVFLVGGTTGDDHFTAGLGFFQGFPLGERINLNAKADGRNPDSDVSIPSLNAPIWLYGEEGNDILSGQGTGGTSTGPLASPLLVFDGPGADLVTGGNGADEFRQDDIVDPNDVFSGAGGMDRLSYVRTGAVNVTVNNAADDGAAGEHDNVGTDIEEIVTGTGADTLVGGPGTQILNAGSGINTVSGGPGNDILIAGTDHDTFHGGPGKRDLVSYRNRSHPVGVTLDHVANDGEPAEGDLIGADVEGAIGSTDDDQLTGNAGPNWLYGSGGGDILVGGAGNDHMSGTIFGDEFGAEFDGSDVFFGGPGKDTVDESNHVGNLVLTVDGVKDDQVAGHPEQGIDNIRPDVENVVGGDGDDDITGSNGANRLVGGPGNDTLSGLGGPDVLVPGPGADTLSGGAAPDTAMYAGAASAITANLNSGAATGDGDDLLSSLERLGGSAHDDHLTGSGLPNVISGGGGDDTLSGLAGDDSLIGGPGDDELAGGPGTDTCKQGPGTGPKSSCEH